VFDFVPELAPLLVTATMEGCEKELPVAAIVTVEVASISQPVTANEYETAMQENSPPSWIAIADDSRRARGYMRQASRHAEEDRVRNRAAELIDALIAGGFRGNYVAQQLRVSRRTLSRWRYRQQHPQPVLPRGRPCKESPPGERRSVLEFFDQEGGHVGLPTLRDQFPHLPRCELQDLQADYRRHYRATHRRSSARLTWHVPGTVWAIDHVVPPSPIDGVDLAALAVRDLGSGMQLGWLPVSDQSEQAASAALETLFLQYGPPLVLKSDNGSAFKSEAFQAMLARYGVAWLPSPPYMPWYNGGCEAGNYSLEIRTDHFAQPTGRWTSDCLEAARRQANELTRPWGRPGPTHAERWSAREPIDPKIRSLFVTAVERQRREILDALQDKFDPENQNQQRHIQRQAVRRALLEAGLLTITRRSIRLPINPKKWARFS
jgi:transposase InsO family protein